MPRPQWKTERTRDEDEHSKELKKEVGASSSFVMLLTVATNHTLHTERPDDIVHISKRRSVWRKIKLEIKMQWQKLNKTSI